MRWIGGNKYRYNVALQDSRKNACEESHFLPSPPSDYLPNYIANIFAQI